MVYQILAAFALDSCIKSKLRLTLIALLGILLPVMAWAIFELMWTQTPADASVWQTTASFVTLGVVIFHWTMLITIAIGCVIVIVMKGPGYVADAYPLSHSDFPLIRSPELPPIST